MLTGPWKFSDLRAGTIGLPKNGLKVFSCFHCGGGSSMGYKLAGFDVLGGVEIDPEMMSLYRANHRPDPRYSFLMPVQDFKSLENLPAELFDLDILDGSPPCSSFSMAGSREKAWSEKKKFREGQAEQVLDDLFFHFIDIAKRLQPKVVVAENVKGLIQGNARGYVHDIFKAYDEAGYESQLFLLNASRMGVPQTRERTFFVSRRRDLNLPKIKLEFNETSRTVRDAWTDLNDTGETLTPRGIELWRKTMPGSSFAKANNGSWFNWIRLSLDKPSNTIPATCRLTHPQEPRFLGDIEACRLQTFPDDYDFGAADARYVCGMSVPPFMMMRVAAAIGEQIFGITGAT